MASEPVEDTRDDGSVERDYGAEYSDESFWEKLAVSAVRAGKEIVEKALVLYYCLQDDDTPAWARGTIMGALGYLILPVDAVPDILPGAGYTDDLAVLAVAFALVLAHIKREHKRAAREKMKEWFGDDVLATDGDWMRRAVAGMTGALLCAVLVLAAGPAPAQEWAQFRGPGAAGVAADNPALPERWSATENVAWRTPLPGLGWSSPIVAGGLVFLTTVVSDGEVETPESGWYRFGERDAPADVHHWLVYALDLETGEVRWRRELHGGVPASSHHMKNTFASETPVTDGERLYVLFGNVGLYALGLDGTLLWSRELPPAETRNGWGTASSPVLHDGRLYLVVDNEAQSYIAALSAETGAEVWRTDRDEGSNWSTPYVWENAERTEIVTTGTDRVRSYGLDGRLLWELAGMSTIVIPTPVAAHGLLYLESGYIADFFRPVYAIRPGASGDISLAEGETANRYVAWSLEQGGSYHPSPLVYGDHYYTLLDRGLMTCHDARTGAEVYGRQRIDVGQAFTASPWAYNGKVFALSEQGTTYVIEAGPEFRILAENPLDEFTMATPAILDDSLIIRTAEAVYRIAER